MSRRMHRWFDCAKCGRSNPDYLTFGARGRDYCLHHIPRLVRLSMRIRAWMRGHA